MTMPLYLIRQSLPKRSIIFSVFLGLLLFVLSQTAGLVHAEIHHFHQHTSTCDVFDNLGHPLDSVEVYSPKIAPPLPYIHANISLFSGYQPPALTHYFSRGPPII